MDYSQCRLGAEAVREEHRLCADVTWTIGGDPIPHKIFVRTPQWRQSEAHSLDHATQGQEDVSDDYTVSS